MFFNNMIAYRLTGKFPADEQALIAALEAYAFTPCDSQQLSRYGWVKHSLTDSLVHAQAGVFLISAQKEEKILPPAVIKEIVDEKIELIEDEQARKVYRKERDQIKDEVIINLLPRAFSRHTRTQALILPDAGWIIVESGTHKRAEELLTLLRASLGSLPIALPEAKQSPSAVMTNWLETGNGLPAGITVLDECELRDNLVESGVIKIKGQDLNDDEFTAHLEAGKRVVKLAIEWEEQLRFMIGEDLTVKRVKLTEEYNEQRSQDSQEDQVAQFDADVNRIALECQRLFPALIEAFGGLAE